ncbi:MAG: cytochrome c biogenesis CcdA family protein [Mycobacteriales bacterium]
MPLANGAADAATHGPLLIALAVSVLAGMVSFASPCVLPLVPGYLSYVAGLSGADVEQTRASEDSRRRRGFLRSLSSPTVLGTLLFIAGFATVFTLLGAAFGEAGRWLLAYQPVIEAVVGALVLLMGLAFLGWIPGLSRELRLRTLPTAGLAGAPVLGAVFALGWTPCLGPTLAAVQGLSFVEGSATRGAVLSAAYALGLGIPFLCCALGFRWFAISIGWLRRHAGWVRWIGGGLLVIVGALLLSGLWNDAVIWLRGYVGVGEIGI